MESRRVDDLEHPPRQSIRGRVAGDDECDPLLRSAQVANWLSVSKSTLVRWRKSGHGPEVLWLSEDLPRYRTSDVQRWLRSRAS
ncbi:helix-turn-helix domain-containing protein [Nocardioides sp. R-C-SC26]|uniref:helix-turn-helix transcriptional regulator n=1 Tax=Nocardioides sp. R-C-SC26 TaxID=2870414 RepID=UPI0027E1B0C2|nr:helix-turn-helix domain-containing protein [Nocardioides sp. R-C-SC26]